MSLPGGGGNGGTSDTTLVGLDAAPPCSSGFEPRIDPIESSVLSAGAAAGGGAIPLLPPPPPVRVGVSTSSVSSEASRTTSRGSFSALGGKGSARRPAPSRRATAAASSWRLRKTAMAMATAITAIASVSMSEAPPPAVRGRPATTAPSRVTLTDIDSVAPSSSSTVASPSPPPPPSNPPPPAYTTPQPRFSKRTWPVCDESVIWKQSACSFVAAVEKHAVSLKRTSRRSPRFRCCTSWSSTRADAW